MMMKLKYTMNTTGFKIVLKGFISAHVAGLGIFIPQTDVANAENGLRQMILLMVSALIVGGWTMMNNELKFKVHETGLMTADHVKVDGDAKEIIRQVQMATGLPARTIVSRMIKYCADKWEVEEV